MNGSPRFRDRRIWRFGFWIEHGWGLECVEEGYAVGRFEVEVGFSEGERWLQLRKRYESRAVCYFLLVFAGVRLGFRSYVWSGGLGFV